LLVEPYIMPRERRAFRQGDVTAVVRAVEKAGKSVARVEVDPEGTVTVFTGSPEDSPDDTRKEHLAEKFHDALRQKRQARPRKGTAA
jgi:hypothetical protein